MASNIDHYLVLLLLFTFTATATAPGSSLPPFSQGTNMLSELSGLRELAEDICRSAMDRYVITSNRWPYPPITRLELEEVTTAFLRETQYLHEYYFAFFARATLRHHPQGPPHLVYMILRYIVPLSIRLADDVEIPGGLHLAMVSDAWLFFTSTRELNS
ncbi:hypothetical protein AXF42_Ash012070 [Apostasia shenzhenica]|uniref:Uncharacterized protein n=1 Tax=Apostasia shenzhenica TaxID=1088818 RepID=A0A2I0AJQ8_9ASPA|nr:hypothetical protein AXF42_Ash012070 [Apostasia shenzhenica]